MEKHASINGLGPLGNDALAAEIRSRLGSDVGLAYSQPQLAGGVVTTADDYARFLRKVLANGLLMHDALGTHAVCTNPLNCSEAVSTPIPPELSWHYSIGHWVEDDPDVGDGAFSSAGLFGFYPWIDAGKTTYGIVARHVANMEARADLGPVRRADSQGLVHGIAAVAAARSARSWSRTSPRPPPPSPRWRSSRRSGGAA